MFLEGDAAAAQQEISCYNTSWPGTNPAGGRFDKDVARQLFSVISFLRVRARGRAAERCHERSAKMKSFSLLQAVLGAALLSLTMNASAAPAPAPANPPRGDTYTQN